MPDVRSAASFREKFDQIVAARERYKDQIEKGEREIKYTKKKRTS